MLRRHRRELGELSLQEELNISPFVCDLHEAIGWPRRLLFLHHRDRGSPERTQFQETLDLAFQCRTCLQQQRALLH